MMQKMKVMMADLVDWYAMLDHITAGTADFPAIPEPAEKKSASESARPIQRSVSNEEGQKLELM
ncbi:MAG: hypothetical protein ACK5U7_08535, partial [Bacteroidota bacterium]